MEKEPPIFGACVQVFEAEKNHSVGGTKPVAEALGALSIEIKSINWKVLAQVPLLMDRDRLSDKLCVRCVR
jgi:hypothetical protein